MVSPVINPSYPVGDTAVTGWTCALCNMWVSWGDQHFCGKSTDAAPQPIVINRDLVVIEKLDRIIELLESLEGR